MVGIDAKPSKFMIRHSLENRPLENRLKWTPTLLTPNSTETKTTMVLLGKRNNSLPLKPTETLSGLPHVKASNPPLCIHPPRLYNKIRAINSMREAFSRLLYSIVLTGTGGTRDKFKSMLRKNKKHIPLPAVGLCLYFLDHYDS